MTDKEKMLTELRSHIGKTGSVNTAKDPVNLPMIHHWCEAMEDFNPNYLDPTHAQQGPHKGLVAPPAMLNAWTMQGLRGKEGPSDDPQGISNNMLNEAGYIGVVATNSEHVYNRYLKEGDLISFTQKLVDVSEEKHTALGIGHFVTTESEFHNQDGEHVGSMFFRILKFIPGTGKTTATETDTDGESNQPPAPELPARRPAPGMNANTQFFWDALKRNELCIQVCEGCKSLQHPPGVRCPKCGSSSLGWQKVSGRGTLYSHCTVHYPRTAAFKEPPVVALVELEEGVRIISNITDCPKEKIQIGMDLQVWFHQEKGEKGEKGEDSTYFPLFRPARPPRNTTTLELGDISPGQELPICPIPLTPTSIVSTAIASRDYQDVHHDRDLAQIKGSKDIFMNILTSSGLAARYVSDWIGPDAVFKNLKIRLGAPNYPYDCMVMSGKVAEVTKTGLQVSFQGINSLGPHLTGTADLELPK